MPAISSLSSRWYADVERGSMLGIAYAGFGLATVCLDFKIKDRFDKFIYVCIYLIGDGLSNFCLLL